MFGPKIELVLQTRLSLELSQNYQQKLTRHWNKTLKSPYAFQPHESEGFVTLREILIENANLGDFASTFLKQVLRQGTLEDKLRRMRDEKMIVAVGFGLGYDSEWLLDATLGGYKTLWLDVSDFACEMAQASMDLQEKGLRTRCINGPKPEVKQGEIRSILLNPSSIELDLDTVAIWYFCRTLGCLSERSAKIVLRQLGYDSLSDNADPHKRNQVVIINALSDYNPGYVGTTSHLRSKKFILSNAELGAERKLEIEGEEHHVYLGKIVTAMTLQAT